MVMSPEEWLATQTGTQAPAVAAPVTPEQPVPASVQQPPVQQPPVQTATTPPAGPQSPEEWIAAQSQGVQQRNPNATLPELEQALVQAQGAGDTAYASQLERVIADEKAARAKSPIWGIPDVYDENSIVQATMPQKPEPTMLEKMKGAAEATLTALTGATGGAAGQIYGTLKQLIQEISTGEYGTMEAANRVEEAAMRHAAGLTYEPRTEKGQEYAQNVGEFAGEYLAPLGPMAAELRPIAESARFVPGATRAALAESPTAAKVVTAAEKVTKPVIDIVTGEGKKQLARDIKADPFNKDFAKYKVVNGIGVIDKNAEAAMKQGWRDGFITSVRESDAADKTAYKKMMNIFKIGKKNDRFRAEHRPADIVGETFSNRVNQLFNIKKKSVQELDTAAEGLKGKPVDYANAFDTFEAKLKDLGVKIAKGGDDLDVEPDFQVGNTKVSLIGSDIEGDVASEALLKKVFTRLGKGDFEDGYDLHRAKRWLDTQVEYGKKSKDGLLNATANVVKGLRRNINDSLREASPEYKAANIKYMDSLNSLESIQKAVGSKKDLAGTNVDKALGQESRKLLSKYGSRINMMDAINEAENVVKKYGGKTEGDITGQIIFANELDHMFGDVAPGSFRAQIGAKTGLETAAEAATKSKSGLAVDLVKGTYNKIRGINEENAIKAIEKLINEE